MHARGTQIRYSGIRQTNQTKSMSSPRLQEIEETNASVQSPPRQPLLTTILLLLLNIFFMLLGLGGPLLLRLYFIHGGSRLWLSSFLQVAGTPIILIPIFLYSFIRNRRPFQLPLSMFVTSAVLGLFFGLDGYLYSYGSSYLPISTTSIIFSSQLAFTALFAFLINRQRLTMYSINAVVLMTIGAVLLALGANKDWLPGETSRQYIIGFFMMLASAALMGLLLPVMERMFKMVKEGVNYGMVMELQFIFGVFSSGFDLVGMAANKDFQAMTREGREFSLGETKYYVVLICGAILFQFAILGIMGVIACSSSLLGGIVTAAILPVSEVMAVIFFHEKFDGNKGIALVICLWGFASYLYGEMRLTQEQTVEKLEATTNMP